MLYYWRDLDEISPQYDDCPNVCGESEKPAREFCDICPIKEAEETFKAELIEMLDERCPGKWQKYDLDGLRRTVVDIIHLQEMNTADRTITTDRLISIFLSEKNKQLRIDRWNDRQKTNS